MLRTRLGPRVPCTVRAHDLTTPEMTALSLPLTLCDDLDSGRVPLGLALPALNAHGAERRSDNGTVAVTKLDA